MAPLHSLRADAIADGDAADAAVPRMVTTDVAVAQCRAAGSASGSSAQWYSGECDRPTGLCAMHMNVHHICCIKH